MTGQTFSEMRQEVLSKKLALIEFTRNNVIERLLNEPQHTESLCHCLDALHANTLRILSELAALQA